ncbi:hypothetical protein [Allocoleopsis sp.]|uniref:hypothetical protein n=1 Tax=Allocoleopsis sp. TaxID=3088169 RepID=UPI002FD29DF3
MSYTSDYDNIKMMAKAVASDVIMEQIGVTKESLEGTKYHGANVTRVAAALAGKQLFAR